MTELQGKDEGTYNLKVHLYPMTATQDEINFAEAATSTLKYVVNKPAFVPRMRNAVFTRSTRRNESGRYLQTTANSQIVEIVLAGREWRMPADREVSLRVKLAEFDNDGTVGSVTPPPVNTPPDQLPSKLVITTNKYWFRKFQGKSDVLALSAHFMHEWMHLTGFSHRKVNEQGQTVSTKPDRKDVAYQTGHIVVKLGRTVLEAQGIVPEVVRLAGEGYYEAYGYTQLDLDEGV